MNYGGTMSRQTGTSLSPPIPSTTALMTPYVKGLSFNKSIMEVFVEQPLALPWSAKKVFTKGRSMYNVP